MLHVTSEFRPGIKLADLTPLFWLPRVLQPPALLQVRVHSGQAMFAHAGSLPAIVASAHTGMDALPASTEMGDTVLEFDRKRVHYSYPPGYDALKETLERERDAAAAACGSSGILAGE
jgi:hypothetical protein